MIVVRLRIVFAAVGGFLHGFVGLGALADDRATPAVPRGDHDAVACAHHPPLSPAGVRRALAIRAAGRRSCC